MKTDDGRDPGWPNRAMRYCWAGPWTLLAVLTAPAVRLTGGRGAVHSGVLELSGGLLRPLLRHLPPGRVAAITLGHAVLAVDAEALETTRNHERVHVAQYEKWGPLFPVVYLAASLAAWRRGEHYYRDNRFEREARLADQG